MECPSCGRTLRIGKDSPLKIEYPPEKLQEFTAGQLSIEQLNEFAIFSYTRDMLCYNPNCSKFAGDPDNPTNKREFIHADNEPETQSMVKVDINNPRALAGKIKIIDK